MDLSIQTLISYLNSTLYSRKTLLLSHSIFLVKPMVMHLNKHCEFASYREFASVFEGLNCGCHVGDIPTPCSRKTSLLMDLGQGGCHI